MREATIPARHLKKGDIVYAFSRWIRVLEVRQRKYGGTDVRLDGVGMRSYAHGVEVRVISPEEPTIPTHPAPLDGGFAGKQIVKKLPWNVEPGDYIFSPGDLEWVEVSEVETYYNNGVTLYYAGGMRRCYDNERIEVLVNCTTRFRTEAKAHTVKIGDYIVIAGSQRQVTKIGQIDGWLIFLCANGIAKYADPETPIDVYRGRIKRSASEIRAGDRIVEDHQTFTVEEVAVVLTCSPSRIGGKTRTVRRDDTFDVIDD